MNRSGSAPWYSSGLRFACTRCGRCCTIPGYVWLDAGEMRGLAEFLDLSLDDFTRRYVRQVGDRYSLIEKSTSECIFWEAAGPRPGCQVYSARPEQCRTFPFWKRNLVDEEVWNEVEEDCPGTGTGTGRLYSAAEIKRLARGHGETGPADSQEPTHCGGGPPPQMQVTSGEQ